MLSCFEKSLGRQRVSSGLYPRSAWDPVPALMSFCLLDMKLLLKCSGLLHSLPSFFTVLAQAPSAHLQAEAAPSPVLSHLNPLNPFST